MEYRITHITQYTYSGPVGVCHNVVMLSPRESNHVRCQDHEMIIEPMPGYRSRRHDLFGNQIHHFSVEESHRELTITASSHVDVLRQPLAPLTDSPSWESVVDAVARQTDPHWPDAAVFVFDSTRIQRSEAFAAFARPSFDPGAPILVAAADLTARIFSGFQYDKSATDVNTPTTDSFDKRAGVCQDFAHVAVACCRSLGVPARYVSGYLRTLPPPGQARLIGSDQSHAWFSVYAGPDRGWVDFDPTNNCVCQTDHIPIAWGRDYDDVVPIRGVFVGGGEHTLAVSVDVSPVGE